jgi:predicted esterase
LYCQQTSSSGQNMDGQQLPNGSRSKQRCDNEALPDSRRTGIGDVVLWSVLGCGALVILSCGIVGIGGAAWFLMARAPQGVPPVVVNPDEVDDESEADNQHVPGELPQPTLSLVPPNPPGAKFGSTDLTTLDPRSLRGAAFQLYGQRRYRQALQFQFQALIKDQIGQYNLACYYARAGDIPAALYWLQDAGREEGVDVDHATRDEDLVDVRKDPRWPKLRNYLRKCERYWEASGYSETSLVVPQNIAPGTPIPVFIGLHGFGSSAHEFVSPDQYQAFADQMGAAVVGVSGTNCRGKHSFVWSEDAEKDAARVETAMREIAGQLTAAEGQIVLFGFSQGGTVAAELAARHLQRFAGAILLSPGSTTHVDPSRLPRFPEERRPGLVAVCGGGEHPDTLKYTEGYAEAYRSRGARAYLKVDAGMNQHAFPPDFDEKFPMWGKFVLDPAAPTPE